MEEAGGAGMSSEGSDGSQGGEYRPTMVTQLSSQFDSKAG